jgi:hypothetical protein
MWFFKGEGVEIPCHCWIWQALSLAVWQSFAALVLFDVSASRAFAGEKKRPNPDGFGRRRTLSPGP